MLSAEYIVRGKTWHIVFILSRRTEIWKFVRLSDMLIVALPVWFVMGFADVYRKCKKTWLLDTYVCTVTKRGWKESSRKAISRLGE